MTDDATQLLALAARLDAACAAIDKQVTEVHAVADELVELANGGEVEPPIEPEPLPELILSRTNVTAVETLPAGALLGCRLITAAVTFHKPPGAQNEKLVGADSTANSKGGMCMERVAAGKYSVWVQDPAEGTKMVQLPAPEPGDPTFVTFELTDTALAGSVGEADGNFTQPPGEPDPFDGPAALLAGYWNGKQVDPADARIHELRAYRTWSEAQIERDRDEWADLFPSA